MTNGNDTISGKIAEAVGCIAGGFIAGTHGAHVGRHIGGLIGRFLL